MDCRCVAAITQASVSGLFSITERAFPATLPTLPDEHRYVREEPKQPESTFCPELRPRWTSPRIRRPNSRRRRTTTPSSAHPWGLATLSGLEVWERFSFLGMQAVLVLYFADTAADGGLGMAPGTAASVAAAYGTMVYLVSVAGGWLADRILGSYRAVLWAGILIACGHCAMAVPITALTWTGLGLIGAGTGLLKPNVATLVGALYRTDDDRRDAGFALYYTAINIGAFAGPLVTGWLGEHEGWHWGFSAATALATLLAVAGWLTMDRSPRWSRSSATCPTPCTSASTAPSPWRPA